MAVIQKQPVKRRKIYEEVVDRLEGMMLRGELKPGDAMPSERELMDSFQIGRTSVREALFALQKMGLITVRNGERAFVTRPSAERLVNELSGTVRHMLAHPDGLAEFQQARTIVECALARNAAENATEEDLEELSRALEANRLAIGDPDLFTQTDLAFHYAIIKIAHNSIFTALHAAVYGWLSDQRLTGLRREGADKSAFAGHLDVFTAIANHDADAADAAMHDHLAKVSENYLVGRQAALVGREG